MLLLAFPSVGSGGIISITGVEEGRWDQDGYSVIVATIRNVHRDPAIKYPDWFATLEPTATLCGNFDASLCPSMKVSFNCDGGMTSSIAAVPAEGAAVMVVLERGENAVDITSAYCMFMPGNSSLVAVNGLDDPKVKETLTRLQAARKAGAAKAAAATQPAAPASAP
jgi:hypothetical protein